MRLPLKQGSATTWVVIPSAIVIFALAILQYRWSSRVSEATAVRLADSLQMSLMNWQKDFFRYFSEIALALRIDPLEDTPGDINQYVRRLAEWKALAKYPNLISGVYVLDAKSIHAVSEGSRQEVIEKLRPDLEKAAPRNQSSSFGIGDPSAGWLFDPGVPAMFHRVVLDGKPAWLAIELNQREIEDHILGDLSQTYFQGTNGLDYQIAVVSKAMGHVIYESDKGFGDPEPSDADGVIDVFGRPFERGPAVHVFHAPSEDKGPSPLAKISWFPLVRDTPEELDWRLVVRHRRGGALGAFVNELHRRDLAIGFGVLLVLAINMGMLIVTSHRAQRLAQLQMNFVTAVSHELRTPLTAIISGAENIRSGVVSGGEQMKQYGSVIGNQAKQLYGLVERILMFGSTRQGKHRYKIEPLDVEELVEASLASAAELTEASSFTVERDVAPNLPQVKGDPAALAMCLQNLITNALKYGREKAWIGIRAVAKDGEVQISVADRGVGITPSDLPHIFEPFYRSPDVEETQIRGTGLGLALAKSIAEDMSGRITVESTPYEGSVFTLHLKVA